VRVRPAVPADGPALAGLWRQLDELHAELQPGYFRRPQVTRPPETARILADPCQLLAVAEVGELAGLVHAQLYETPPQPLLVARRRVHIDALVVDPRFRRRGLGRQLLRAADTWARQRGAQELLLTLWAGNEAAEAFYRAIGFAPVNVCLARPL